MLEVTVNRERRTFREGTTILAAARELGIDIPTLCHDERLAPNGACRLCIVEVNSSDRYVTACSTQLADGMDIRTASPGVEATRRTMLALLAADYPCEAVNSAREKPFHRLLDQYGVTASSGESRARFTDTRHPYLHVNMEQCITCTRCIRICDEVQGQFVWKAWNRGAETEVRPHHGNSLIESDCVSCGACADTCPTGAIEDRAVIEHGAPDTWTRTTCPYCGTGCEMLVGTKNDRIIQSLPILDAPVSKGHLCVKGRYAFGFVHSPERATDPMIREGATWRKVTWPEAVQFVAQRLGEIVATHGADSIGVLGSARGTNEENYLAQKFARVVLGTNNVDCCARVCHAPTAAGMKMTLGTGAATNSFDDIERAGAFLICGCNPTENHPIVGARIKQAVLRGAKLIVIDPREIELTSYASVHLQLRPGTNVPLLNAIAHVIVEEGLVDAATLRERVSDFEAFREFIAEWTPERAAVICGVNADSIRQAARLYAGSEAAMCFHGLGMTEHVQGTEGVICLVNLALLTGNFGRPGTGVNPLRGQNNVQGSAHMGCEPGNLTGYVSIEQGRDVFEIAWAAQLPRNKGLNLMEMIDAAGDQRLHALWAIGYDVAFTNPNAAITKAALDQVGLVIVQDLFFNELARDFGHVFLPACSSFEKDGTFMNSERRVQRVRTAVNPVGQSRADWEIICDVAKAMGHREQFEYDSAEAIWDEVRSVWKAGAGISYARIETHGLQWPCPSDEHPGTPILHMDSFPMGKTAPLKRIDFHPTTEVANEEYPFLLTTGRTLYQFNAGTMTMRTPNAELRSTDTVDISPEDLARLSFRDGEPVQLRSRHGSAILPIRSDSRLKSGELFATFHSTDVSLNQLTGPHRDNHVQTPEYKIVAVALHQLSSEPADA